MYLRKLELHGFKSFAERTVLHFDPGITAIVGPNGCGKSNVVDAVRWVIGEQRARILRSEKMENVIFNGTSKRRALGMSEVLLTIENTRSVLPTEYTEVQLGRRLYRSGDSEYLLNGVPCRLKDVTDLFMDTGMGAGAYSVIELKMIEDILSESNEDRRRLFEEAAGITKYKLRRKQTLSKLDSTQADLNRVRDLTDEIGKRVRSLKRQAEKAVKYKEYRSRLEQLELALARLEFDRLTEQERTLTSEITSLRRQIEAASAKEANGEATLEQLRLELVRREQALSDRQRALNGHLESVRALETERRLAAERLESARRELDRIRREADEEALRRDELAAEAERLEAELAAAEPALEAALARLRETETERDRTRAAVEAQRRQLQELRQEERRADEERTGRRRSLDRLTSRLELLEAELVRLSAQGDELGTSAGERERRHEAAAAWLEEARAAAASARQALEEATRQRAEATEALEAAQEELRGAERRREAVAAEVQLLESLVSSYEEFPDTVRYLAAAREWTDRDLRTVADVLTGPDEDRVALEAALGPFASCIVVESEEEARRAVGLLRRERKGQATFILLDRLPAAAAELPEVPAGAAPLRQRVRLAAPAYASLADALLAGRYVVDDLEQARALAAGAAPGVSVYARTGEWVDARGMLHGGSEQAAPSPLAGRLSRREQLGETRTLLGTLEEEIARLREAVDGRRAELEGIPFGDRQQQLRNAEKALLEAEKELDRASYEREAVGNRQADLQGRVAEVRASLEAGRSEREALEAAFQELDLTVETRRAERAGAEEQFALAEQESRTAVGRHSDASIAAVQARNRRDNAARDLERTGGQIETLESRAAERARRRGELEATITETEARKDALEAEYEGIRSGGAELEEAVAYAEEAMRQSREAIANVEGDLRNDRRHRETLVREENARAVRLAEVHTRREDLIRHIQDDFEVAIETTEVTLEEALDERSARGEVQELRSKIRGLGSVNELALEAYEEERERFEFLTTQQQDLEEAEGKLLETIGEINTTASERFRETFAAIEANFSSIFQRLFGGDAAAQVVLVDPDDPLESPIEINARPRGKRPSTISQLSGGEKTLTAIALLFAIYLVKPSPFCILDEVDAPLDDANVERFMRLIREFAKDTQFILVTHNKRTMEAADRLYGITMQEQGVSRLVGVKFDEAVEIVGA